MGRRWNRRSWSRLETLLAAFGYRFVAGWSWIQRRYRRAFSWLSRHARFEFYVALTAAALAFLLWDSQSANRYLAKADNALFDEVIKWRPAAFEPKRSGRVVVVEIDDCSIDYYKHSEDPEERQSWPWSRYLHAELLDKLDAIGVDAVGYDLLFIDASNRFVDPLTGDLDDNGDANLETTALGTGGRFIFGASRLHRNLDHGRRAIWVSQMPAAFALAPQAWCESPRVAMALPYGKSMRAHAGLLNVTRDDDGVLRGVPLHERIGHWALPSLALAVAARANDRKPHSYPAAVRINWNRHERLPTVSFANLLEGREICVRNEPPPGKPERPAPKLTDASVVLVGYNASGLSDVKPTPVGMLPGVHVHAEAVDALLAGNAIRMWTVPVAAKYLGAAVLIMVIGFAFFRGEPAWELDGLLATFSLVLLVAFLALAAAGIVLDIFAALAFVSFHFGLCQVYAATQRGRAIGHDDYCAQFDPARDRWLALVRLRFVPDPDPDRHALGRRVHDYRRRLRRFLYGAHGVVALEGVVEHESWLWEAMADITVLMWGGRSPTVVAATAQRELLALRAHLARHDAVLSDRGSVRMACLISVAAAPEESIGQTRSRVSRLLGRLLCSREERSLAEFESFTADETDAQVAAPLGGEPAS